MTELRSSTNETAAQGWQRLGHQGNRGTWRVMLQLEDGTLKECASPRYNFDLGLSPYHQALEWMLKNVHPDHKPVLVWAQQTTTKDIQGYYDRK